tara:strand:- start:4153 stop:4668 length:516 start_codon:yes stop_codon:yes gene_type:complete
MQKVDQPDIVENMETVDQQSNDLSRQQQATKDTAQDETFLPPHEIDNMAYVKEATLNNFHFDLEVAVTPQERSKGLMGRLSIDENRAMLFVYEKDVEPVFWMKNTAMPLDLMFIDSTGKIESIHPMKTQAGVEDRELDTFSPGKPIRYAIEIKGGLAGEIGFNIGSLILFK